MDEEGIDDAQTGGMALSIHPFIGIVRVRTHYGVGSIDRSNSPAGHHELPLQRANQDLLPTT